MTYSRDDKVRACELAVRFGSVEEASKALHGSPSQCTIRKWLSEPGRHGLPEGLDWDACLASRDDVRRERELMGPVDALWGEMLVTVVGHGFAGCDFRALWDTLRSVDADQEDLYAGPAGAEDAVARARAFRAATGWSFVRANRQVSDGHRWCMPDATVQGLRDTMADLQASGWLDAERFNEAYTVSHEAWHMARDFRLVGTMLGAALGIDWKRTDPWLLLELLASLKSRLSACSRERTVGAPASDTAHSDLVAVMAEVPDQALAHRRRVPLGGERDAAGEARFDALLAARGRCQRCRKGPSDGAVLVAASDGSVLCRSCRDEAVAAVDASKGPEWLASVLGAEAAPLPDPDVPEGRIDLFEHNRRSYVQVLRRFRTVRRTCVLKPCGTGKAVIGFKLVEDNPNRRVLWLCPSALIFEEQRASIERQCPGIEFPNLTCMTYAKLANGHWGTPGSWDIVILDEFHRAGADRWGSGVGALLERNSDAKVLGLTATPTRYGERGADGGARDMAKELFFGDVADSMTLEEAWRGGVLPAPKIVSAMYGEPPEVKELERRIKSLSDGAAKDELLERHAQLVRDVAGAAGLPQIFAKHLKGPRHKLVVFCPTIADCDEMSGMADEWFGTVGPVRVRVAHSMVPDPQAVVDGFRADDGDGVALLFTVNQVNEGLHVKGVTGVVMVRATKSHIVFSQQLGRAMESGVGSVPIVFDLVNNWSAMGGIGSFGGPAPGRPRQRSLQSLQGAARDLDSVRDCGAEVVDETLDALEVARQLDVAVGRVEAEEAERADIAEAFEALRAERRLRIEEDLEVALKAAGLWKGATEETATEGSAA